MSVINLYSQEDASREGFTFSAEIRHMIGKGNHTYDEVTYKGDVRANSLRLYAGYFFTPQVNLNLGIGADRYNKYLGENTLPLFIQSKYYISPKRNSFYFAGEGGIQLTPADTFEKGYLLAAFAGKEFSFKNNRTALNLHLGYNYHKSKFAIVDANKHAIFLGVAFMIK